MTCWFCSTQPTTQTRVSRCQRAASKPLLHRFYLQSCWWPNPDAPSRIRHYYWVEVPAATPMAWSHVVSAGEGDKGMTFHLSFRPLDDNNLTPGYGWEDALPVLPARRIPGTAATRELFEETGLRTHEKQHSPHVAAAHRAPDLAPGLHASRRPVASAANLVGGSRSLRRTLAAAR